MKLAVGPLTTGTYVVHAVAHPGNYYGVHKDPGGTKLGVIDDKEHEGIKWYLEKVGENRFTSRNKSSGVLFSVNAVDKQQCEAVSEEAETEWFIEPTDVDGEYTSRPAHDKSVFATATPLTDEGIVKLGPPSNSELARFNWYRVDDD